MKLSCIANWNVGVVLELLQSTKGNTEGSVFLFDMPLVKFNTSLTSLILLESKYCCGIFPSLLVFLE